jgi:ElaB/YqjD/DUF883 family membrane-anchored ribosome-binding protein
MNMATTAEHFANAAHEAGIKSDGALRRKGSQLHKFFDDVEELLRKVTPMQDAELSRLRNRVESSIEHAKSSVTSTATTAIENTRAAAKATDEYVHRSPWIVIGATAVAGLLLGALLRGGRDK